MHITAPGKYSMITHSRTWQWALAPFTVFNSNTLPLFLQFQKTTGNYIGSKQLFQFHCVDVMAPICTATVSRFLYSETNWPVTQGAALLFAALTHSSIFITLFTAYLVPKGTKLQHGITWHDTLWHQILCSGHSAGKQALFFQFCPAERFSQRTSEDTFIG